MRDPSRPTVRLPRRRAEFPTSLARRHSRQVSCPVYGLSSTFLHPFAPGPLRPFLATVSALTPARSVAVVLGLSPAATPSAPHEQVSLIHALGLPTLPSPTICGRSASPRHVTCRRVGPRWLPHGISPNGELGASPLASRLATSHRPNRVRSPTDWPFTSCCFPPRLATTQLQSVTSHVNSERTFTSPTKVRSQAH